MPDERTPDEPTPDARPDVALGTIAKEWARIGCTGFGGPPTHIAMLRRLAVERRGMVRRDRVRGRHRSDEPSPRPGVDPTRHLLRVAVARRCRARSSVGPASSAPDWRDHRTGRSVPGLEPAHLDQGRRTGRRRSGGTGRRQRRPRTDPGQLAQGRAGRGPAGALDRLRRRRSPGGRHRRHLPGARPAGVRAGGGRPLGFGSGRPNASRVSSWRPWASWSPAV